MIIIHHKNKELEALFTTGKSTLYKDLSKKGFVRILHAFCDLLNILDNVKDLARFRAWQYSRKKWSSVIIAGAGVSRNLLFSESNNGQAITILELI